MTEAEFLTHVYRAPSSGCLLWVAEGKAHLTEDGYGFWWMGGPGNWWKMYAHRWAHHQWIGPIPRGLTVDHECHGWDLSCVKGPRCLHRRCVNPDHLVAVTFAVNQQRRAGRKARQRQEVGA